MSVIGSNILAGASGNQGYFLTNSLRFRSSASAYLNRTPASATNRQTWTWSSWMKRGSLDSWQIFFGAWDGAGGNDTTRLDLAFEAANTISITGGVTVFRNSTQVFRDPSAWYHIVVVADTTNATAQNRLRIYVNGVEITSWGTNNTVTQNTSLAVDNNASHVIGARGNSPTQYFDGYMTEINFIDGQALTPSSFGETSATTGVWIPKKYTGTYGTNGFYLPFTDNSALTTSSNAGLGKDFSGNSNYWTTNNISITSGETYDSMTDVPTLTSATAANYATFNPLAKGANVTLSEGNLKYSTSSASGVNGIVSMRISTGMKSYFEFTCGSVSLYRNISIGGVTYAGDSGSISGGTGGTGTFATWTTGDVVRFACDYNAGTIACYKNATLQTTVTGVTNTSEWEINAAQSTNTTGEYTANFGQQPFAYSVPSGFSGLNTFNLPTPTIGATASTTANKYMDVVLYSGNNSTQNIAVGFQPDWVWSKCRNVGRSHRLSDAVRGSTRDLYSDTTDDEENNGSITAFISTGFSLDNATGSTYNTSGENYVSWAWKANGAGSSNTAGSITSTVSASTTAGFSIVTYSANGSTGTVGHGLGVAPSMIIVKKRNAAERWCVFHTSTSNAYIYLNETFAADTTNANVRFGNNTVVVQPTSTLFTIGSSNDVNGTSGTYVAYCFAQVAGYSAFGSYTGNGSTDGTFIFTGFRPKFVMVKNTVDPNNWILFDTARNTYNIVDLQLYPNTSDAEVSGGSSNGIDFLSNGFKVRSSNNWGNRNGDTIIYACFAENPFKYANAR